MTWGIMLWGYDVIICRFLFCDRPTSITTVFTSSRLCLLTVTSSMTRPSPQLYSGLVGSPCLPPSMISSSANQRVPLGWASCLGLCLELSVEQVTVTLSKHFNQSQPLKTKFLGCKYQIRGSVLPSRGRTVFTYMYMFMCTTGVVWLVVCPGLFLGLIYNLPMTFHPRLTAGCFFIGQQMLKGPLLSSS